MATWAARVVDTLIELRADGYSFDRAWSMAIRQHPSDGGGPGTGTPRLFEEDGRAAEGLVTFFKRVCDDAWHDQGSDRPIRHFRVELVRDVDDASPALRSTSSHGRYRQAA